MDAYEHLGKSSPPKVSAGYDSHGDANTGSIPTSETKHPDYLELFDENHSPLKEVDIYETIDDRHVPSHKQVPLPPVQTTERYQSMTTVPKRTYRKKAFPIIIAVNAAVILVIVIIVACSFTRNTEHGCALDIVFVVDSSGSINDKDPANWKLTLGFLRGIVDQVNIDETRIAAISFGNIATIGFNLSNGYKTEAEYFAAINRLTYDGGYTNTTGALRAARTQIFTSAGGDRPGVTNLLVLLTDGANTRENDGLEQETVKVRNRGIRVVAIGITDRVSRKELNLIASRDDKGTPLVYTVQGFSQLESELIHTLTISKICGSP